MTVLTEQPKVVGSDRSISAYGRARSTITESPLLEPLVVLLAACIVLSP